MAMLLRSIRARILLVVALVAIVPVVIVGGWMTRTAARSAENLVRARLADRLDQLALTVDQGWVRHRSALLDLAALPELRHAFGASPEVPRSTPPAAIAGAIERAGQPFETLRAFDAAGQELWTVAGGAVPHQSPRPAVPLTAVVHDSPFGSAIGSLATSLPVSRLVTDRAASPGSLGATVGVFDTGTGAPLVPLPFDRPPDLSRPFMWGGDRWIAVTRDLSEPALTLVAAAPLTPFEQPLRETARAGAWLLGIVALAGLAFATVLTTRMTGSFRTLATAAEAVAGGDLDRQVDERGADELARVARAFNGMTTSLRSTLQALADQRALARTGEFAASLAHEIRNPLTAIRVDLQVVQESLPSGARGRRPLDRALADIERLDRTVGGALMATRAARDGRKPIDLRGPLESAVTAAERTAARPLGIAIDAPPSPVLVLGDSAALEQLFLNLLLNASEAVREGGAVRVSVDGTPATVIVRVHDTGVGLTPDVARRAFDPLFTTRAGGTGLGLTIAGRLARAMEGSIELTGSAGGGATATVTLPRPEVESL